MDADLTSHLSDSSPIRRSLMRFPLDISPAGRRLAKVLGIALLLLLPVLPVPEFWITQLNYIGLYALVALGIVLLTGVGGLTSFGQAAFAGVGAYASAYVTTQLGWSPWAGLAVGCVLTSVVALLLGAITLRMSGHYLPLATIAWCLALFYLMGNLEILGKYDGILGVPPIEIAGTQLREGRKMFYLIWVIAIVAALGVIWLLDSRPGRIMRSLNTSTGGGSTMPESMGASTYRHKLQMFVMAALLASISGWLFAHFQRTVNPSPFGINYGIQYLFMAVIGGIGTVGGAFAGAAIVKIVEEQLQVVLPRLLGTGGNYEIIVFGILLVLILKLAPKGLWPVVTRLWTQRPRFVPHVGDSPLLDRPKPEAQSTLLRVNAVRKQFGGLVAVNDVSLEIKCGEIVGLIGPNGAGKSTMFNLISGVLPLSAGSVEFRDRRADGRPSRLLAREGMSRTFQHVKLVPDMTVLENVAIGSYSRTNSGVLSALLRTNQREEARAFAEAARQLKRIGLEKHMHAAAGSLALGQQRLVEIARALACDPVLLLLDEPAAGLRHQEKGELSRVMQQLRSEGLSMLLVEHDMDFVMKLTDRIVVVEFGTKLVEGTPLEIQQSPAVRAAYLGLDH